jgi:hypothetical protein
MKKGLPEDTGESELPYTSELAEFIGEMEEAMEHEEIPREHEDRVKAYSQSLLEEPDRE